jgi:hypothetical protein
MKKVEALGIQKLVKRPYKDTVMKNGVAVESQMKGKFYWICTSSEGRFVIEEGHKFLQDLDNGILFTVTLNKDGDNCEYITHTTTREEINFARTHAEIESIRMSAASFKRVENPEELV